MRAEWNPDELGEVHVKITPESVEQQWYQIFERDGKVGTGRLCLSISWQGSTGKRLFHVELDRLTEASNPPAFLTAIVQAIRQGGLGHEGIFRLSGQANRISEMIVTNKSRFVFFVR
jgi:hypothetical protein